MGFRSLVLVLAIVACRATPKPDDRPVVEVSLQWPGATAVALEREVVQLVEQRAASIDGVRAIEARIDGERATVTIAADDLDRTIHELRHAFDARMPPEVLPPVLGYARREPVVRYGVSGTLPIALLSKHARDEVVPRLERLPGVGKIELRGFAREVTVVTPDLDMLAARGLTIVDALGATDAVVRGQKIVREPGEQTIAIYAQRGAAPREVRASIDAAMRDVRGALPVVFEILELAPPRQTAAIEIRGPDLDELDAIADALAKQLAATGITDVARDPPAPTSEVQLVVDRDRAAQLGVSMADIATTLRALDPGGDVVLDLRPDDLSRIHVRARAGQLVPISAVVSQTHGEQRAILRRDRERVVEIVIRSGDAAVARRLAREYALPIGYRVIVR